MKNNVKTTEDRRKRNIKKRSYWWFLWRMWLLMIPILLLIYSFWSKEFQTEYKLGEHTGNFEDLEIRSVDEYMEKYRNTEIKEISSEDLNKIAHSICTWNYSYKNPFEYQKALYFEIYDAEAGMPVFVTDSTEKWFLRARTGEESTYYSLDMNFLWDTELLSEIQSHSLYAGSVHDKKATDMQWLLYQRGVLSDEIKHIPDGYRMYIEVEDFYTKDNQTCIPGRCKVIKAYEDDHAPNEIVAELDGTPENPRTYTHIIPAENPAIALYSGTSASLPYYIDLMDESINPDFPLSDIADRAEEKGHTIYTFSKEYGRYQVTYLMLAPADWQELNWLRIDMKAIMLDWLFILPIAFALLAIPVFLLHLRRYTRQEQEEYRRALTNALAHDLKSPLMVISGYAENLASGVHPEKEGYYAEQILEKTQYMNHLIHNVLTLSKLEEQLVRPPLQEYDAASEIRRLLQMHAEELQARGIRMELTKDACMLKANPEMFGQMAANLVSNALCFTPDGGVIELKISGKRLILSNSCENAADLNPEELVQPFVKADKSRSGSKGSGIGLSIVMTLAKRQKLSCEISVKDGLFQVSLA